MLQRLVPFVLFVPCLVAQATGVEKKPGKPPVPPAAMTTITGKELLAHATFLASDELQGRLTGSPGQRAAAKYIQQHFAKLGLEPLGDEADGKRGWLQEYGVTRTYITPASKLGLGGLELSNGFAVLADQPAEIAVRGKLRFCGLGRVGDDDADVAATDDLNGAVAVVVLKHPRRNDDSPLGIEKKFGMTLPMFTRLGAISRAVHKRGAAAVLFLQAKDTVGFSDVLNYLSPAPGKDLLDARFRGGDGAMTNMRKMVAGAAPLPTFVLSVPASHQVLAKLGVGEAQVEALVGKGEAVKDAKADLDAELAVGVARDAEATACNVVAVLRGTDKTLRDEAVVYSAHMDHVGTRIDGEVFNGADDNASGTAGLLAIASAYVKSKDKPRRSVIFLSVSGEELGLWGSAYFADHPTWPQDKIVADVNTDMIGRSGPEAGPTQIMVTPSHDHDMFSTIVQDAARFAAVLGSTLVDGDKYYTRSDHYNFAKKGIPVVFFCNGEHDDYHQVSDSADKLDAAHMERFARLAFWTGWAVANRTERPQTIGKQPDWR